MALLKCVTLLLFESQLIKQEVLLGRVFTSLVKNGSQAVCSVAVSHEHRGVILSFKSRYPQMDSTFAVLS